MPEWMQVVAGVVVGIAAVCGALVLGFWPRWRDEPSRLAPPSGAPHDAGVGTWLGDGSSGDALHHP